MVTPSQWNTELQSLLEFHHFTHYNKCELMVKRQILPYLNILFYVLLLSFTPLNYRLCLFSFSLFLLAHIYSPYTPSVHFSLTNKWTMQQWRMRKPLTKYPKQQIFRLSLLLQPQHLVCFAIISEVYKSTSVWLQWTQSHWEGKGEIQSWE